MLSAEASARARESNQDGSPRCRGCGRHSVLVEPLSDRKRIVTRLGDGKPSTTSSTTRQAFTDYADAIGDLYAELPITPRSVRRDELDVARQLHGEGVRLLHIEAALLVTTARQLLRTEPQPIERIRSLRDVVPLVEQARRARVSHGYVAYLRHKLRHVLEADRDGSTTPRRRRSRALTSAMSKGGLHVPNRK